MPEEALLYQSSSKNVQLKCAVELMERLPIKDGDYVIDIGCGTGDLVKCISEKVGINGRVIGIDPDSSRIEIARDLCRNCPNAEFHVCKSIELPVLSRPYDFAISTSVLHWISSQEKLKTFQLIYETLKPGGTFAALFAIEKSGGNIELFHQLCENKIENYRTLREQTEKNVLYYEGSNWVRKHLDLIGFEDIYSREVLLEMDIGSPKAFIDWLAATYFSTIIGYLDLEKAWSIIDGYNVPWECSVSGGLTLPSKVIELLVKKRECGKF